jgi:NADH:ubiquinone oxidoreductase subunit 4 (subunit M)
LSLAVPLLMLMIVRLRDLKRIIAYSSVAHISMVFYVMILGYSIGKKGAIYIIFYHGFISPLIFWIIGLIAW